ncbi:hypothetical protein BCV69DRAFT_275624 [Microstroma glucosiphilum]|uniref:Uncharacterized protein n=1 Tax=Pseudomicrostroma glucosiphilum TaxID=1684307 RepID=A0A316UC04_9BASI|nr:hypothetical protein BCV69DRAFT_275624 [Pseudomicrostroma glucosiphilum]PWN22682.1 hypothetical protein BCV69DRAFT_275624 [Pseudomicrostroma glucosiphilum]
MEQAFRSWAPFAPFKGSAAFTVTPALTPSIERSNHFDAPSRAEEAARSSSVDSNVTLVDSQEVKGSLPCPPSHHGPAPSIDGSSRGIVPVLSRGVFKADASWHWAMTDRELYHRLQNLSSYPSAVPIARRRVFGEMASLLADAALLEQDGTHVFSLAKCFDPDEFKAFLQRSHDATTDKFSAYNTRRAEASRKYVDEEMPQQSQKGSSLDRTLRKRRRAVAGQEMFRGDRELAKAWMRRSSVVKYVDGAWLQHLHRTTTGIGGLADGRGGEGSPAWLRAQRRAARNSWQVMSEELGDGDIFRSHVAIYDNTMDALAREDEGESASLPPKGHDRAFTEWEGAAGHDPHHPKSSAGLGQDSDGNARCWRAAVAQLALSISPNEFLPESLGWNAAYEGLPLHLLISARELEELDLDAYYFWLHISIDNAATGHAAMARECINDLLREAQAAKGQDFADEEWARVKLGFALAEAIPTTPILSEGGDEDDHTPYELTWTSVTQEDVSPASTSSPTHHISSDVIRSQLVDILKSKAPTAHGLHHGVRARLAGESLSHWLDPIHAQERVPQLLDALSANPIWIKPGSAGESKFVKEFEWGGKMFGAMTGNEVHVLRTWVDSLAVQGEEEKDGIRLLSDSDAEQAGREALMVWLSAQLPEGVQPRTALETPEWLRSPTLPTVLLGADRKLGDKLESWADFTAKVVPDLYKGLVERPDAISKLPTNLPALLDVLDPSSNTGSTTSTSSDFLASLSSLYPCPAMPASSTNLLDALAPILLTLPAPLERSLSLSPGRLASHLGMAAVKTLRVLHGFTEVSDPAQQVERGGDGREVGCMGTEDGQGLGIWELVERAWQRRWAGESVSGNAEAPSIALDAFKDGPPARLALPSLLLLLSSQFWELAPILLGLQLFLVQALLGNKRVLAVLSGLDCSDVLTEKGVVNSSSGESHQVRAQLEGMVLHANRWVQRAIEVAVERESSEEMREQVRSEVARGWRIARQGVQVALEG